MAAARRASSTADLLRTVTRAQVVLAQNAIEASWDMLDEQGIDPSPTLGADVTRLSGVASDGRSLADLLALIQTAQQFDLIVGTQLQDVGRAGQAIIMGHPQITHYVRSLSLPSCGRCIVLAGKPSKAAAFPRHPRCDCISVPTTAGRAEALAINPREMFERMSPADQQKAVTKAGAEAIRLGADISQVVNARAGVSTAQILRGNSTRWATTGRAVRTDVYGQQLYVTTEGMTKRGLAYRARGGKPVRLMPESILELSGDDKAEAQRLLRAHGYLR